MLKTLYAGFAQSLPTILPVGTMDRLGALYRDRSVRQIGTLLVLGVSVLFLLRTARHADIVGILNSVSTADIARLLAYCVFYAALLMLLARGWSLALEVPRIGWQRAVAVYGTSVLPKYLPGSVHQYLSRHIIGRRYGWHAPTMAYSSVLELALHVLCSLTVAMLLLIWHGRPSTLDLDWRFAVVGLTVIGAVAVTLWAFRRFSPSILLGAIGYQLVFFAGLAALAMACGVMSGVAAQQLPTVGGLFLLAWLIGLVVPLAPAGLGVREAAGTAMLSGIIGAESALFILGTMRVVTLGGDVLMIAAGFVCQKAEGVRA